MVLCVGPSHWKTMLYRAKFILKNLFQNHENGRFHRDETQILKQNSPIYAVH